MVFNPGDVGDYEAREHGDDYLDGMVFAPNQVIKCSFQLQGKCKLSECEVSASFSGDTRVLRGPSYLVSKMTSRHQE